MRHRHVPNAARLRGIAAGLALSLATLTVLFGLAELVVRFAVDTHNLGTIIRFDPLTGWALVPGARRHVVDRARGLDYRVRIDANGRRAVTVRPRGPVRHRILFLGDSVTFGSGVEAPDRFADRLARVLADSVEVIDAGVPGWGPDQEILWYEQRGRSLGADVVVLVFFMPNDVVNVALDHLFLGTAPKPRFVAEGDSLRLIPVRAPRSAPPRHRLRAWLRRSHFLVWAWRRVRAARAHGAPPVDVSTSRPARLASNGVAPVDAASGGETGAPGEAPPPATDRRGAGGRAGTAIRSRARVVLPDGFAHPHDDTLTHWSVFLRPEPARIRAAWTVTGRLLVRLADDCRRDGARLVVLAFPLMEADDHWRAWLVNHAGVDSTRLDFAAPYERLRRICRRAGVSLIHPIAAFRAEARRRVLFLRRDGHPNAAGHAVAARALLEALTPALAPDGPGASREAPDRSTRP